MSIPGSASPLLLASTAAAAGNYQIERSLRFNPADTPYLQRVFSGNGSNMKIRTFSCWVKRSGLGANKEIFSSSNTRLVFDGDTLYAEVAGALLQTTQVFRDVSAWYHILFAWDTTQATSSNRSKLYVNGTQITTFSTANYPTQNADTTFATTTGNSIIGQYQNIAGYVLDGYLAETYFIDGQALTPSSFTEVSATTGQLIPKTYSGTYGTNGFQLKFADNSSNTATTLGKDTSGNSNNWTPNNLSVTAGAGNDSLVDTPTSYGTDTGVGGEVRGNYCTMNPLDTSGTTLSNGNLDAVSTGAGGISKGTFAVSSGKWYWEVTNNNGNTSIGIALASVAPTIAYLGISQTWSYYTVNGNIYTNGTSYSYGATYGAGDVIGIALDLDNDTLTFYKNGVSQGVAATGLTGTYTPACGNDQATVSYTFNFGQRPFAYQTPGTNRPAATFLALCDTNLGAPLVAKPNTVMDVALYTGNNSSLTISGFNLSPDFIWFKARSYAGSHALVDIVRGASNQLNSNLTNAEGTNTAGAGLQSFNSDGFTLGTESNANGSTNGNQTYAAWMWDAGTSTVSNTAGSITSQVRANVSAGFSVVTATKTSGTHTVGHGLGVTPSLIIVKNRAATSDWIVAHSALNMSTQLVYLNKTDSVYTSTPLWGGAPTSSVFYVAGTMLASNDFVAYCFAPVVGYSNGFSYTGNGSADGSFVYLGFRPRLIMLKRSDSTSNWTLLDTSREGYNVDNDPLYPNLSDAEGTTDLLDITSNGFKLRSTDASVNASAGTYIGFAWAEAPFAYSRAR